MRALALFGLLVSLSFSHELIELGTHNDALAKEYNRDIIIIDNRAFIAPSECISQRLYGGISQGDTWLNDIKKEHVELDDKTFKALSKQSIDKQKITQNITNKIEQKVAKEFIDKANGHLFGGMSQGRVDLSTQKIMPLTSKEQSKTPKKYSCKILDTFDGYKLSVDRFELLRDGVRKKIVDGVVRH